MNGEERGLGAQPPPRDRFGRFDGRRVNVDQVPRLPTFPAQWALEDPRARSYFVFWTDANGKLVRALLMAPADDGRAVAVSTPYALRLRLSVEHRRQWGGHVLFYLCPSCGRPRRHLYPWPMLDGRLDRDLKPQCRQCAGLRYPCQGIPGGGPGVEPWHPRAVSDPRMVATEFPRSPVFRPE